MYVDLTHSVFYVYVHIHLVKLFVCQSLAYDISQTTVDSLRLLTVLSLRMALSDILLL